MDSLTLILHTEIINVILGPLYVLKHMTYVSIIEELNNDGKYMRRIIFSVIVMFFVRK